MQEVYWSKTPLGPVGKWPQSLKTAVRIMLTSRQPIWLGWGEELIKLYNDPYKAIVRGKHPAALGQPASIVWREIWTEIGPMLQTAMGGIEGTYVESQLLIMERNGYPEETYYTFSYSPIPDDQGGVGGIFCANTDDTDRVIGERQLTLLKDLAARTADARTFDDACRLSAVSLENDRHDFPFALIYLAEPATDTFVLAAASGVKSDQVAAVDHAVNTATVWPLAEVLRTQKPSIIMDLSRLSDHLSTDAWKQPPYQAVVVPIVSSDKTGKAGILIAGLNPFRLFDDRYQRFVDLVVGQIAASIANAQRYEEERRRAEALAELDHAKTAFFSNVSHELRTPLTLMLGPLEELKTQFGRSTSSLDVSQYQQVEVVHRNGLRLLKLVNQLLDFSRIEAGRAQIVYEETDLVAFTAELASVFRSVIEKAGISLIVDCLPLPEFVFVDRDMWEKIVLNLLSNAFKFTFAGEIEVALRPNGKHVELSIRDTGTGIPEDQLGKIFERFHRVAGSQGRTYEGTGIGLSLVQELARLHGGSVSVESVYGKGSTFRVFIPMGKSHLSHKHIGVARDKTSTALGAMPFVEEAERWLPSEEGAAPKVLSAEPSIGSGFSYAPSVLTRSRVLLADDNADMRDYVRRLLSSQGYEVEAVADGQAALDRAQAKPPDIVLADVMMPRLDGFGLLRALRADERMRAIPVIMLSARAGEEARVEGLGAGADDYVIKPFSARELLARVESQVKMAAIRGQATVAQQERQAWEAGQKEALQAALDGAPLEASLGVLVRTAIEQLGQDTRAVFYLANLDGTSSRHVVGMPAEYATHVDGFNIGPESLACGLAAHRGQAVLTADVRNDSLWKPWLWLAERFEYRGCWSFPIHTSARKFIGTFAIYWRRPREATERDRELASLMTQTAAIIISRHAEAEARRRAEKQIESELADSRLLQSISVEIIQMDDSQALYDKILDAAVSMMRSDFASLQMLYPERGQGGELRLLACRGYDPAAVKFWEWVRADSGCTCGEAMRTGRRAVAADVQTCAFMAGSADRANALRMGMLAMQSTPLISRSGGLLGMLSTHWKQPHQPSERDLRLFDVLARMAADLIERAQAAEDLREREAQLKAETDALARLNELSSRLWRSRRMREGLQEMLAATIELLGADMGNVQILDVEHRVLTIEVQRGFGPDYFASFREASTEDPSACGRALRSGKRIVIEDVEADALYAPLRAVARAAGYRAVQSTPLMTRNGDLLGMISTHFRTVHRPTDQDLRRLDLYVRQAADFIERCRMEDTLREREQETKRARDYAEATLRTSPVPLLVLEKDFRVNTANDAFYDTFQVNPVETQGRLVYELGNGQWNIPKLRELLETILPQHTMFKEFEVTHDFEFIGRRTMLLNARRMNEPDAHERIVLVIEDITERKAIQERLRSFAQELEAQVEDRTRDLVQSQNRLRAMATELNLAEQRERKRIATELHDHLQQTLVLGRLLVGQGKRAAATVPACLDVMKKMDDIFSEALTYSRTLVADLSPPVLREHGLPAGLKWLGEYMKKHQITVTVTVPEKYDLKLPEDQAVLLFQSVRELLINSSKYAGTKQAEVRMERYDGRLRIEVSDQGIGFDLAAAAGTPSGDISSKFGLFSIQERMRALGGNFDIQSTLGEGTTATLTLPIRSRAEIHDTANKERHVIGRRRDDKASALFPATHDSVLKKNAPIRILLVDDHPMMRQGLRSLVTAYDHLEVVGEAGDGAEAVELAQRLDPDVVVMDINMPMMDGIEATQRIKANQPTTIVIGLSVNQSVDTERKMKTAGAFSYLTKESAVDALCHAIEEAVSYEPHTTVRPVY